MHRVAKREKSNLLGQLIIAEFYASAGTSDFCANYDWFLPVKDLVPTLSGQPGPGARPDTRTYPCQLLPAHKSVKNSLTNKIPVQQKGEKRKHEKINKQCRRSETEWAKAKRVRRCSKLPADQKCNRTRSGPGTGPGPSPSMQDMQFAFADLMLPPSLLLFRLFIATPWRCHTMSFRSFINVNGTGPVQCNYETFWFLPLCPLLSPLHSAFSTMFAVGWRSNWQRFVAESTQISLTSFWHSKVVAMSTSDLTSP